MRPDESTTVARYDAIAEWYMSWIGSSAGLVCDPGHGWLADDLGGQRWLDAACGAGRTSRELARRGADVVGVDLSGHLIAAARAEEDAQPLGVVYMIADLTEPDSWWDDEPFDGAVCEMALMDIDDLEGTISSVTAALRPGGRWLISMVHPCFPGNERGLPSWPPDRGYAAEGRWSSQHHNPDGVRLRVGSSHRTLSTYVNSLLRTGLLLDAVFEPPADVPTWLVLGVRRSD